MGGVDTRTYMGPQPQGMMGKCGVDCKREGECEELDGRERAALASRGNQHLSIHA